VQVLVVGAGVVGSAIALELARRGQDVLVLDRGEPGQGCSYGNAGWLTPSLATPLPAPGVLTTGLGWLLDPDSPLSIRVSARPDWLRWMAGFVRATSRERFTRGTRALVGLSSASLEAYAALDRETGGALKLVRRGLLEVAQTPAGLATAVAESRRMASFGVESRVLSGDEVRETEPAVRGRVEGGVLFPGDAHCEPLATVRALVGLAQGAGASFVAGAETFRFEVARGRVAAVHTTRGRFEAEAVVLAAGTASKRLGRMLGLRIPLLGGKGYAVTVRGIEPAPRMPIKVWERRLALTPREGSVRLAGTLELVDGDEGITARRVEAIVRGARGVLAVPDPPDVVELWRGLRPCTPDGLPIIGPAPGLSNLVIATGHQMCGLHTAPATARLAADLVTGAPPSFPPEPFRAGRF
jgi:D-amino-acid dehydrogenase